MITTRLGFGVESITFHALGDGRIECRRIYNGKAIDPIYYKKHGVHPVAGALTVAQRKSFNDAYEQEFGVRLPEYDVE